MTTPILLPILPDPDQIVWDLVFTVLGEPASKANNRKVKMIGGRKQFVRSDKAYSYAKSFAIQCPRLDELIEDDVMVWIDIWYASRRPDLDESIILDAMQKLVYRNDRQVKLKVVRHHLDRDNPRATVRLRRI